MAGARLKQATRTNMAYYNPSLHHRRSIRLKGYDYSQAGLYFITICTQHHACLFGEIHTNAPDIGNPHIRATTRVAPTDALVAAPNAPEMILNAAGKMIESEWLKLPERFPNIRLHEFAIMPNHFHAIIQIVGAALAAAPTLPERAATRAAPTKSVGDMIGAFKSISTGHYIRRVKQHEWPPFNGKLWQRNYWEHVIRDEESYLHIAEYIVNNPAGWQNDKLYAHQ